MIKLIIEVIYLYTTEVVLAQQLPVVGKDDTHEYYIKFKDQDSELPNDLNLFKESIEDSTA